MNKIFRGPRTRTGESLAEVLVAMLIIVLSALLLVSMVSASGDIDMKVRGQDSDFYEALSALEAGSGNVETGNVETGTVTISVALGGSNIKIKVNTYTQDGMYAYAYKAEETTP